MVILDTDHVSFLEWEQGEEYSRLKSRLDAWPPTEVATTVVSYEEQTRGWLAYMAGARKLTQQIEAYRRLHRHLQLYCRMQVLDFDEAAAVQSQQLKHLQRRIGLADVRIAAIALTRQALLLSRNLTDFRLVPGLNVEDWTRIPHS